MQYIREHALHHLLNKTASDMGHILEEMPVTRGSASPPVGALPDASHVVQSSGPSAAGTPQAIWAVRLQKGGGRIDLD